MADQNLIRIVIADDHEVVRGGVKAMLEKAPDMEVVGEASNGRDALQRITSASPDVAVLDVSMPDLNGIELVRMLRRRECLVRCLMLSMHASGEFVTASLDAGADGYLLKEASGTEILNAVREVYAGRLYISEQIRDHYASDQLGGVTSPLARLSARERQVLQLVVEGRTSIEIAETVHLSPKTVDTYRSRLMKKLGLSNVPELVKFALQHGLTTPT